MMIIHITALDIVLPCHACKLVLYEPCSRQSSITTKYLFTEIDSAHENEWQAWQLGQYMHLCRM
jgi:hypothetical protein